MEIHKYTRRYLLLLITLVIFQTSGCTQTSSGNANVGDATNTKALHESIKKAMKEFQVPGASVAVRFGDSISWTRGFGIRDIDNKIPVTSHTRFAIGSVSKQFTAAAVMMMAEEGKLSLSDTLALFFPELPKAYHSITLKQLLTHKSGIRRDFKTTHSLVDGELLDALKKAPLDFTPGSSWNYSNTGFILLGMVVEQVSGQPFKEFLEHRIFKPLKMNQTVYLTPETGSPERATGYESGMERLQALRFLPARYGAGSIVSTSHDMLLWGKAMAENRLLSSKSRREMWLEQQTLKEASLKDEFGRNFITGYGWWITDDNGKRLVRHGGSVDGFLSTLDYYPENDLTIIILLNNEGALHAIKKIAHLIRDFYLNKKR